MEKVLEQFKAIAPYIIDSVMTRLTGNETEDAAIAIIHQEILHYFEAHQNMTMQYLAFNEDQRRAFADVMYDIHEVKGKKSPATLNPVYEKFVKETGKTSALDFICRTPSTDDRLFSVYQRADGMQLAVDSQGTALLMRPFKQAGWLRAGFEANLEYYWLVDKDLEINATPKLTAFLNDGVLDTEEVI